MTGIELKNSPTAHLAVISSLTVIRRIFLQALSDTPGCIRTPGDHKEIASASGAEQLAADLRALLPTQP